MENLDICPGWREIPNLLITCISEMQHFCLSLQCLRRVWLPIYGLISYILACSPILISSMHHPLTFSHLPCAKGSYHTHWAGGTAVAMFSFPLVRESSAIPTSPSLPFTVSRGVTIYVIGCLIHFYTWWQKDSSLYSNIYIIKQFWIQL